jgi:predicted dehydrogenase
MVGYMKRFAVTFAEAKRYLDEEVLGKIVSFDSYAYSSDFSRVKPGSLKSGSRGGVLSDLGSHVIDLALWFFGDLKVESASLKSIIGGTWEDSVDFSVAKSNMNGSFHVSWCMDEYRLPSFGLTIRGDKGVIEVNDYYLKMDLSDRETKIWFKHDLNDHVAFLLGDSEYCREDETFVNSILTGGRAEPSFRTASRVDRIIDQVKKVGGWGGS